MNTHCMPPGAANFDVKLDANLDANAALFDHRLSYEAPQPADFIQVPDSIRPGHAQALLRALAMIEDLGMEDNACEHDDSPLASQRMEAKLDLSLLLLGRVLEQARPALPVRVVRWSIRGARLAHPDAAGFSPGTQGVLQIQLCDWLPEPLELPASVLAADGAHLWLQFPAFPVALEDALERHLFRQHRRQIAQAREAQAESS